MELDDFPKGLRMAAWEMCAAIPCAEPLDYDVLLSMLEQTDRADWRKGNTPEVLYSPDGIRARIALRGRFHDDDPGPLHGIPAIEASVARLGRAGILARAAERDFLDLSAVKEMMR